MTENYKDADAIVTIEGKDYALYKNGPLNQHPYMVDISTGGIPRGEQRALLKSYLRLNGFDIESFGERGPHWYVRKAIKAAQGKSAGTAMQAAFPSSDTSASYKRKPARKKNYLPLTEENIESVHQQVLASPDYGQNYAIIHDALRRFPQNIDRELVAMKVALIDSTNSTNISRYIKKISFSEIVELILSVRDFDVRVAQGDPQLVSQLARSNGRINLFSFASKYCTYHNIDVYERDDFSIFDNVVKETLPHYVPRLTEFAVEAWRRTYDYAAFNNCIGELLDQKEIQIPFKRRKLDHFLWYSNH